MKKSYKYIEFVFDGNWKCYNKQSQTKLAKIEYYPYFKQYSVTWFMMGAVFSAGCLRDIAHFLDQLNQQDKDNLFEKQNADII